MTHPRYLEISVVILSEAKDLCLRRARSFASLRMTGAGHCSREGLSPNVWTHPGAVAKSFSFPSVCPSRAPQEPASPMFFVDGAALRAAPSTKNIGEEPATSSQNKALRSPRYCATALVTCPWAGNQAISTNYYKLMDRCR